MYNRKEFYSILQESWSSSTLKNDQRTDKSNYKPIGIVSNVSKISGRCLYSESYNCFDKNIFSKHQCGFHEGFNTQYVLLFIIEKIKIADDNKNFVLLISQIYQKLLTVFVMTYPENCSLRKLPVGKLPHGKILKKKCHLKNCFTIFFLLLTLFPSCFSFLSFS